MIKIKLTTIIILLLVLHACNGQKSKRELQNVTSEIDSENKKSNKPSTENFLLFPDLNNKINQVVRTIFQDSKRNIWFGTESGVFKFDGESLIHIKNIKNESGEKVTIKDITETNDGKIWLGHTDGISSINGESVTNYNETDGLISNDVWSITSGNNGKIWIATINGVCVFDGQEFSNFKLPEGIIDTTKGVSSKKIVHNIKQDSKGTLWFSTNAGLFSYSNDKLINVSKKYDFKTNFINEIFENSKGEFWVSTKKGLYNLNKHTVKNITEGKIIDGKGIGSIAEDKDGKIWFVSNQHFLYTYNKEKLTEYKKTDKNKGPVVFEIFKDQDNRLWFVGFGGAYRLENDKFIHITKNGPW